MDHSTPGLPAHHQACWLTSSQMDLECEERRDEGPKAKAIFTLKFLPTLLLKLSSSQSCAQYSFYKTAHSSGTPSVQGAEWKSLEPHLPLHPTPLGLSFFLYKIDEWDWRGCPPRSALWSLTQRLSRSHSKRGNRRKPVCVRTCLWAGLRSQSPPFLLLAHLWPIWSCQGWGLEAGPGGAQGSLPSSPADPGWGCAGTSAGGGPEDLASGLTEREVNAVMEVTARRHSQW